MQTIRTGCRNPPTLATYLRVWRDTVLIPPLAQQSLPETPEAGQCLGEQRGKVRTYSRGGRRWRASQTLRIWPPRAGDPTIPTIPTILTIPTFRCGRVLVAPVKPMQSRPCAPLLRRGPERCSTSRRSGWTRSARSTTSLVSPPPARANTQTGGRATRGPIKMISLRAEILRTNRGELQTSARRIYLMMRTPMLGMLGAQATEQGR
mmetsp:Transcript_3789/g.8338  ORF Transcript_3789/g.8338 Transcript_3789/m.8338 type:complete len:206 (-) Transcript_3789:119-736(-)